MAGYNKRGPFSAEGENSFSRRRGPETVRRDPAHLRASHPDPRSESHKSPIPHKPGVSQSLSKKHILSPLCLKLKRNPGVPKLPDLKIRNAEKQNTRPASASHHAIRCLMLISECHVATHTHGPGRDDGIRANVVFARDVCFFGRPIRCACDPGGCRN